MSVIVGQCEQCDEATAFNILSKHVVDEGPPTEYSFSSCSICNQPAVFFREDMGDGFEHDPYSRIFPTQDRHIGFGLPKIVRHSYEEAVRCEKAKSWTAAAVMIGRALEAVCKQYDPGSRAMYDGLKKMLADGSISQELYEWATALRVIRNLAAHPTAVSVSRTDAIEALDFLQSILEILYDLRPKFLRMKERQFNREIEARLTES